MADIDIMCGQYSLQCGRYVAAWYDLWLISLYVYCISYIAQTVISMEDENSLLLYICRRTLDYFVWS